jgi:hypothetical protein
LKKESLGAFSQRFVALLYTGLVWANSSTLNILGPSAFNPDKPWVILYGLPVYSTENCGELSIFEGAANTSYLLGL